MRYLLSGLAIAFMVWMLNLGTTTVAQSTPLPHATSDRPIPIHQTADIITGMPICGAYPNSPYYTSVQSLVERYGIDISAVDGSCDVNQLITRGEMAAYLNQGLDRILETVSIMSP